MYYSFSVFFVELLQTFGDSRAKTGWIYSTNSAVHMFSGPLGGFVIVRLGPRVAVMIGGLLAGTGYFLSAFAPNLDFMFLSYGIINAVGTSLNFSGWVVGLSQFWKKHHALVVGIAMAGSGCGVFLLGPCIEFIVHHYGWRGAMLICAGMSLNFCVFGATIYHQLRPSTGNKECFSGIHAKVSSSIVYEKSLSEDNTASSNNESLHSHELSLLSGHVKGEEHLETLGEPSTVLKAISGSSPLPKQREGIIRRWIAFIRNCAFRKNITCKLEPRDSVDSRSVKHLLCSPTFWLLEASCFCSVMATTTVFAVLLDWTRWTGMSSAFPQALAGSGLGDLLGRIMGGIIMGRGLPPLMLFSGNQLLLASTLGCAAVSTTHIQLIASMVGFGTACGLQSVLYALMPSQLSSGVGIARVLGYLLFVTGAGALAGPPLAGMLVDLTESYNSVLILCTAAPTAAAIFNICAHFTAKYYHHKEHKCHKKASSIHV
ncbi:hypothetical protein SK128_011889 [Halocaridina rubra]|uniref:Major facilitator superfamily (MFS) profile domain-containing protein n=1 Tax=Halocaridina rubra TaxID=373956 RepID=A0AAN9A7G8_HALRR